MKQLSDEVEYLKNKLLNKQFKKAAKITQQGKKLKLIKILIY